MLYDQVNNLLIMLGKCTFLELVIRCEGKCLAQGHNYSVNCREKIHFVADDVVAFDAKFTLCLSETIFAFGQSLQNVP